MSSSPWFKFFPSDFIAGVATHTAAERGIYITLLCLMYDKGGLIERNDIRLARLCGCSKPIFTRTIDHLIDSGQISFFDGLISNTRVIEDLKNRNIFGKKMSKAAKKRWQSENEEIPENGDLLDKVAMPKHSVGYATPEAIFQIEEEGTEIDKIFNAWNANAELYDFGKIQLLNAKRKKSLNARIKDYGADQIVQAISEINKRPYLMGQNDRGWRANFDWLLRPSSVINILEGSMYNEGGKKSGWD